MKIGDDQTLGDYWYQHCMETRNVVNARDKTIRELEYERHRRIRIGHSLELTEEKPFHWECAECGIKTKEISIEELLEKGSL